jgi:hypothetical protein
VTSHRPQHEHPAPRVQHGAVLAGVKATPSGWPPASPDPSSRRRLREQPEAGSQPI